MVKYAYAITALLALASAAPVYEAAAGSSSLERRTFGLLSGHGSGGLSGGLHGSAGAKGGLLGGLSGNAGGSGSAGISASAGGFGKIIGGLAGSIGGGADVEGLAGICGKIGAQLQAGGDVDLDVQGDAKGVVSLIGKLAGKLSAEGKVSLGAFLQGVAEAQSQSQDLAIFSRVSRASCLDLTRRR